MTSVGIAIISFAAYSSFQNLEEKIVLSEMALENVEALAEEDDSPCPTGCLDKPGDFCLCNGIIYKLERPKDAETTPPGQTPPPEEVP